MLLAAMPGARSLHRQLFTWLLLPEEVAAAAFCEDEALPLTRNLMVVHGAKTTSS